MVRNKKVLAGIVVLALVVAGAGVGYAKWGGSGSSTKKDLLVILADVQRRTLQDTRDPDRHARASRSGAR